MPEPKLIRSGVDRVRMMLVAGVKGGPLHARIVRGGVGSVAIKGMHMVLMLALMVVLARLLGTEGYGVYSYVLAVVQLLAIPAQLGLPILVVREIAAYQERKEWPLLNGVLKFGFFAIATAALFVSAGVGTIAWTQRWRWSDTQLDTLFWGLLLLLLMTLGNFRGAALRGIKKIIHGLLPENIILPGGLLVLLGGVWVVLPERGMTPDTAMALHVLAAGGAFLVGTWLLARHIPTVAKVAAPEYDIRGWLSSALPLTLIGGMQVVNSRADLIMLGIFGTASDVGVYRVAIDGGILVVFGLRALNMAVAPYFSALWSAGDIKRLQSLVTASSRASFLFALPAAGCLIYFGESILSVVFGTEFEAAYVPLAIIAVGQVLNSAVGSVMVLLSMTGHEKTIMRGLAVAATMNIVMNLVLIPIWGTVGAAVATVVTFAIWNLTLWDATRKQLGINSMAFRRS